jgi:Family of unknown function (DUF6855)
MTAAELSGAGSENDPWVLWKPSLRSQLHMHKDEDHEPPFLACTVGKTVLHYDLRIVDDTVAMLKEHGDWMELGNADEQKPAKADSVEAWARSADNPIGGWYGLNKGLRGWVGNYVSPLMEALGLVELEHNAR